MKLLCENNANSKNNGNKRYIPKMDVIHETKDELELNINDIKNIKNKNRRNSMEGCPSPRRVIEVHTIKNDISNSETCPLSPKKYNFARRSTIQNEIKELINRSEDVDSDNFSGKDIDSNDDERDNFSGYPNESKIGVNTKFNTK